MKAVEIDQLSYTYECASSASLAGIDLRIEEGSCVLLAGESGSGKSTLLNCINGLNPLHYGGTRSGSVRVMGREVAELQLWEIAEFVGTVFQNPNTQFFQCNVEDELAFGMEYRGFSPEEIRSRIGEYSGRMRISGLLQRDIFSISSGERQKVAVAAVASLGPGVLLLDEPSANLDPEATRDLLAILRDLKAEGRTIIVSEHRIHYLRSIIDRVIVLGGGAVHYDGPTDVLSDDDFRGVHGLRSWSYESIAEPQGRITSCEQPPMLRVTDLTLKRRHSAPLLNGISMQIRPGECVGITGPNGAGKTTMARVLAGLEPKATGSVELLGGELAAKSRVGKIVYMPQQADQQLFADTVYEELSMSFKKCPYADKVVSETLAGLDLEPLADKHPHALSGGEKQRVAIAAMLTMKPLVLILDEPTSGMDGRRMVQFAREIRKLLDSERSILIITHDFELMAECCDRVIWVEDGSTARQYDCKSFGELTPWFSCPNRAEAEGEMIAKACPSTGSR